MYNPIFIVEPSSLKILTYSAGCFVFPLIRYIFNPIKISRTYLKKIFAPLRNQKTEFTIR